MRYTLEYASSWTTYRAGTYTSLEDCAQDCATRYGVSMSQFQRDDDGILKATVYSDDAISLMVYEIETPYASVRR